MPHKVGNGAILGIASEDGVASQKRIVLLDRSDMRVVNQTRADEYGAYTFSGLNSDTDDYIVFAVDDDGNPAKQPIIYDYVQPISAHQGGFYWANWYTLAMTYEPMAMFIGVTDNDDITRFSLPFGVGNGPAQTYGVVDVNIPYVMPAAPNIPSVDFTMGLVAKTALMQNNFLTDGANTKLSLELVLDTSKIPIAMEFSTKAMGSSLQDTAMQYYQQDMVTVEYLPTSNEIVSYRNNGTPTTSQVSSFINRVEVNRYSLPAELQNTVLHIIFSADFGISGKLFVNGVLVHTKDLTATNSKVGVIAGQRELIGIVSFKHYSNNGKVNTQLSTFSTPLFANYSNTFSATQALANYNALFVESLPRLTGYSRLVVQDYPTYFFRLHDLNGSNIAIDSLRPSATHASSRLERANKLMISRSEDVPLVTGGAGTMFNGGAMRGEGHTTIPLSDRFLTAEFVARPDDVVISGYQVLLSHRDKSNNPYFEIRRYADKRWCLQWREGSSPALVYFATLADTTAIHHYAFTVDKKALQAKLYVDGVLVETVATTLAAMAVLDNITKDINSMHIGGAVNANLLDVTNPYIGYLAELATYPIVLSANTIKNHYDARLTI